MRISQKLSMCTRSPKPTYDKGRGVLIRYTPLSATIRGALITVSDKYSITDIPLIKYKLYLIRCYKHSLKRCTTPSLLTTIFISIVAQAIAKVPSVALNFFYLVTFHYPHQICWNPDDFVMSWSLFPVNTSIVWVKFYVPLVCLVVLAIGDRFQINEGTMPHSLTSDGGVRHCNYYQVEPTGGCIQGKQWNKQS